MPHTIPTMALLYGQSGDPLTDGPGLQRTENGVTELIVGILDNNRAANAKQAINQMFNGDGKATSGYKYLGLDVWHASAGKPDRSSVSLFYTMQGTVAQVIAIGEHKTKTSYSLCDLGRTAGPFKQGATLQL